MTISPVQITMAIDLDQHNQAMKCQISQARLANTAVNNLNADCSSDYSGHCVDLSVCVAQYNFTSQYSLNSFLLMSRAVTHTKYMPDDDSVSTHYPDLLKRPPKI
jgi:hypothetical protein